MTDHTMIAPHDHTNLLGEQVGVQLLASMNQRALGQTRHEQNRLTQEAAASEAALRSFPSQV
jgi:hypothetical protein